MSQLVRPKVITLREKAAVALWVLQGGGLSSRELYAAGSPRALAEVEALKDSAGTASRWWHSEKIQNYVLELQAIIKDRQEREREQIRKEILAELGAKKRGLVDAAGRLDFTNPDNRKELYNTIIRSSGDDPRTQLDAAKILEQIQKDDREAAKSQRVVRSYLPLRCNECPLYQNERKKVDKKLKNK